MAEHAKKQDHAKNTNFYFYQVRMPVGTIEFHDILRSYVAEKLNRHRSIERETFVLDELVAHPDGFAGSIFRIRSRDLGHVFVTPNTRERPRAMDELLPPGSRIGEMTVFLYVPEAHALVVERNLHGVSAAGICNFFEAARTEYVSPVLIPGTEEPWKPRTTEPTMVLSPMLESETVEHLADFKHVQSIEVVCAGVPPMSEAAVRAVAEFPDNESMREAIALGAESVTLKWTAPRAPMRGVVDWICSYIPFIGREQGPQTTKIHIVGGATPNDRQEIDLVDRVLTQSAEVRSKTLTASFAEKLAALNDAWAARREEVFKTYVERAVTP